MLCRPISRIKDPWYQHSSTFPRARFCLPARLAVAKPAALKAIIHVKRTCKSNDTNI